MNNNREFEETLGVTRIDENVAKLETQKTLPFSQALHILLGTKEGKELKQKKSKKEISAKEFESELKVIAEKYRHLILA
jgi:hypothetical protein